MTTLKWAPPHCTATPHHCAWAKSAALLRRPPTASYQSCLNRIQSCQFFVAVLPTEHFYRAFPAANCPTKTKAHPNFAATLCSAFLSSETELYPLLLRGTTHVLTLLGTDYLAYLACLAALRSPRVTAWKPACGA